MHSINGSNTPAKLRDLWRTPKPIFDYFDKLYNFNLDAYASESDKLCENFIGESDNSHSVDWSDYTNGDSVRAFCNPPYSQPNIRLALEKAKSEAKRGSLSLVLIPNQPAKYWTESVVGYARAITLTLGRISFIDPSTDLPVDGNPGGSAFILYTPTNRRIRRVETVTEYISVDELMA